MKIDQGEYAAKYDEMATLYKKLENQLAQIEAKRRERHRRRVGIEQFISALEAAGTPVIDFDERLWSATVEAVVVHADGRLVFRFMDGSIIERRMD